MSKVEHFQAVVGDGECLLLNEREAAKALGISPRTLWMLRTTGRIAAVVISERCIRYSRSVLAEWVAEQSTAKVVGQ